MSDTRVPLLDLTRMDASERDELRNAFERVLESGRYIGGPEVEALERESADYLEVKHAIGVSSGTDALVAVLMALDLGPGDEVICPTYTFFATAGSVWRTGAKPVFVDIDPVTYNWNEQQALAAVTDKTKAFIPVHLFGQCAEIDRVCALGAEKGIPVIEDAAQAIGTQLRGRSAGSMGTAGCFSFFPSKNLGGLGDGGLVTTNDDEFAHRVQLMRNHGMEPKYYHSMVGGNFRIDALQAALLRVKLRRLEAAHARRRENAKYYGDALRAAGVGADTQAAEDVPMGKVGLPVCVHDSHIYNQYTLRVPGGLRDGLRAYLAENGVGCEVYYPVPLHLQECFKSLGHEPGDFPVAEKAAAETLALPIFPELTETELAHVVERIAAFCNDRA